MIFAMTTTFALAPNTEIAIWRTRRKMANSPGGSLSGSWVELFDILLNAPEIKRIIRVGFTNQWEQVSSRRLKKREKKSQWRRTMKARWEVRQLLQRNRRFKTELCVRLFDYSKLVKLRSQLYEMGEVCPFIWLTPAFFIQRQIMKDLQLDENLTSSSWRLRQTNH